MHDGDLEALLLDLELEPGRRRNKVVEQHRHAHLRANIIIIIIIIIVIIIIIIIIIIIKNNEILIIIIWLVTS